MHSLTHSSPLLLYLVALNIHAFSLFPYELLLSLTLTRSLSLVLPLKRSLSLSSRGLSLFPLLTLVLSLSLRHLSSLSFTRCLSQSLLFSLIRPMNRSLSLSLVVSLNHNCFHSLSVSLSLTRSLSHSVSLSLVHFSSPLCLLLLLCHTSIGLAFYSSPPQAISLSHALPPSHTRCLLISRVVSVSWILDRLSNSAIDWYERVLASFRSKLNAMGSGEH